MRFLMGTLLLLILAMIFRKNKVKGLNLNFLQTDYQLKFERIELVRFNKNLIRDSSIKTFKLNRTTAVVNATVVTKVDMGSELEGVVQAYKFMSNEYRTFPIRFQANICLAGAADVAGIRSMGLKCGNIRSCHFLKERKYELCNWHPDESKLPPYIPSGQYKIEVQFLRFSVEVMVINGYATIFRPIV